MIKDKKRVLLILVLLFLFNLVAWGAVYEVSRPAQMEVIFFDVGQGEAILIKTPERHRILIDGGPTGILENLSREIPFWEREIDLVILTHPHSDHISGLIDVFERYKVRTVLWTGVESEDTSFPKWEKAILNSEVVIARAGQRIKGKSFHLDILYPFSSFEGKRVKDLNTTSIIARLVSAQDSYLFTGDAYFSNERELIEAVSFCAEGSDSVVCRVMVLDSDLLKVGHHGSKTSTSEEFLEAVSPSIAVIFAGRGNRYGHPHKEVLEVLRSYGIRILRTDIEGDIRIR